MSVTKRIILVGCGKMGSAMLEGWRKRGVKDENIIIIDPAVKKIGGIRTFGKAEEIPDDFEPDFILFALKPDVIAKICPSYTKFRKKNVSFISIAAGKDIKSLAEELGKEAGIIRAMPNIPALISEGTTVAISNNAVSEAKKNEATELLEAIGNVHWVDDENIMDSVTAISGSGPAYLFYFTECLINTAKELGIPDKLAEDIVLETITGSIRLLEKTGQEPEDLRKKVTSPGGTTEAALKILMDKEGLRYLLSEAIKAAEKRAKELK